MPARLLGTLLPMKMVRSGSKLKMLHRTLKTKSTDTMKGDVVIVGGSVMGTSIALHLAMNLLGTSTRKLDTKVYVIERDRSYKASSAMLSAGGVRQQFSLPENIKMSMYGAEFLKNIKSLALPDDTEVPDIQFHQNGYLFLADNKNVDVLTRNNQIQRECGATWLDLLSKVQLEEKFPWLNTDGIALGSFSSQNEGYFDPWSYLNIMKKKAIYHGVQFIDGDVIGAEMFTPSPLVSSSCRIRSLTVQMANGGVKHIHGESFVNAAGAWGGKFVDMLATQASRTAKKDDDFSMVPTLLDVPPVARLPVQSRKRCIFQVHCPGLMKNSKGLPVPPTNSPLFVDTSGVYFRPEGGKGRFIVGVSPREDDDKECTDKDLEQVDHELFEEIIWPTICERVPAFEELKVQSAWAGFYEYNTVDQNAIIGFHTEVKNLILCNGFSGHGLQQSPAAGRAVTELLVYGKYTTIDLSRFSFHRIVNNTPIHETGIV